MTRKGLFYEKPRHEWIAKIVTFESQKAAREAARKLLKRAEKARRRTKAVIKKALVLAANRAEASAKRKNLSPRERRKLKKIAEIYRNAYKKIKLS